MIMYYLFPENCLSSKFSTWLQAFLLLVIIAETNACFLFLPAKKWPQMLHFSTNHHSKTSPTLSCTFKALRYSFAFPNIIALNAIHWCSQLEFLVNTEQAIKTPSFYTYSPVLWRRWHVLVFYREVTEEEQDPGRQLGNMLLRQWVNL